MDPNSVLLLRVIFALSLACLGLLVLIGVSGKRQISKILDAVDRVPSVAEQAEHHQQHKDLEEVRTEHNWLKRNGGCALSHRGDNGKAAVS